MYLLLLVFVISASLVGRLLDCHFWNIEIFNLGIVPISNTIFMTCVAELVCQEPEAAEEVISRLQVVEAVGGRVGGALWPRLLRGVPACAALCRALYTALRHMAARALAALAARDPHAVMQELVNEVCKYRLKYNSSRD